MFHEYICISIIHFALYSNLTFSTVNNVKCFRSLLGLLAKIKV